MKVLVVDDEYYARKALLKIIKEWDSTVQIIGEAENGEEALNIICAEQPDIVFADIRMPGFNGIELAKTLYEEYPSVYVVIISGYADFQYAQSVIQYQVRQYILKPVKKMEVFSIMDDFKELLEKKVLALENKKKMQGMIEVSYKLLIENKLNGFMYGAGKVDTALFEQLLHFSLTGISFFIVTIQNNTGMNYNLKTYLEESIKNRFEGVVTFLSSKYTNELIFIKFLKIEDNMVCERDKMKFTHILGDLVSESCKSTESQFSAGTSLLHGNLQELAGAYREASYALDYRLIEGWNKVFEYDVVNRKQKYMNLFDAEMEKVLNANLYNGNSDWIKNYIRKLFMEISNNPNYSIAAIQDMNSVITLVLNRLLKDINETESIKEPHKYIEKAELHDFLFLNDLLKWILQEIERICTIVIESKKSLDPSIIDDLKNFIQDNYNYDISLEGLAKHRYFVNPSYLSRMFKSETGRSFKNYLTELRMNKAKELIKNQSLGISDIAGIVGYNDFSYFIKRFKGFNGETPGQYRNKILVNSGSTE